MSCISGRPKLSTDQDRQLFAESAGTCLLCATTLFPKNPKSTRSIAIAERAHIVAHSDEGPRADSATSVDFRSSPENIILLCPSCHTKVDKSPEDYPADHLKKVKEDRKRAVVNIGGTPVFTTRTEARRAAQRILLRNRLIFRNYGPSPVDGSIDSQEAASNWSMHVVDEIIPNNRLLVALVAVNEDLATPEDHESAELLRQHTDDLERKHTSGLVTAPASRFPAQAESLFEEKS
ncbi:HNH endonuclease [Streptomyces sp. NPDC060188]|uniref:HNH endonuclease n=1 Tax=Streptomyces sp. NPDC060188 TaxID=3347068 RepID=UPI00364F47A7